MNDQSCKTCARINDCNLRMAVFLMNGRSEAERILNNTSKTCSMWRPLESIAKSRLMRPSLN